ncbi:MAG TPA: hypothetical protein VGX94_06335 [Terriglobia bacterium]|nr:hypothetical protein [Terriglobia bacterium]
MENNVLETRVKNLEKKILYLTSFCGLLVVAMIFIMVSSSTQRVKAAENAKVLHLRGLVIEDAQGRARILLGAPFPTVHGRIRQDATTTALLFLDEQGHDRFSIGEKMPAQLNGKVSPQFHRIGAGYGLTIYDPVGNERGGMGFISNGSTVSRAVIALDRPGQDAWGAIVDDKSGFAGTMTLYPPKTANDTNGVVVGTLENKAFITLKSLNNKPRATFAVGPEGLPSFELFDETGKPGPDLLKMTSEGMPAK